MPYNSLVSRSEVAALNTETVSTAMLADVENRSAALTLFKRIPVASSQTRFPVLSALPTAYFVTGDTGLKQTTEAAWDNVYMNVEEIATIVPVPDSVIEDAEFDIFGAIRPLAADAIARVLDAAVFFGTNKPATWPDDIVTAATAAGNTKVRNTTAANGGLAEDFNQLFAKVEADGYPVTGATTDLVYRSRLRGARDTSGQMLMDFQSGTAWGVRLVESMPGMWPSGAGTAELIAGDFQNALLGVRRDVTFDIDRSGVVQDGSGAIVYNAFQQDLTLLRVTFRAGWVVSNPINRVQPVAANRYPFAIMLAP